jgi:hypothetical protein
MALSGDWKFSTFVKFPKSMLNNGFTRPTNVENQDCDSVATRKSWQIKGPQGVVAPWFALDQGEE